MSRQRKSLNKKIKDKEQELMARGFAATVKDANPQSFRRYIDPSLINSELKSIDNIDMNNLTASIMSQTIDSELTPLTFCGDIPKQNNLPKGSKLCGYVEIDGTYHKCASCEHERIIRQIIWENDELRQRYFNTPASFFDQMPRGMLQEEYFAMKDLGFVKISSFKNTPTDMVVFFYNNLTYKQSDIVYPR